jgi:peptide deformylase
LALLKIARMGHPILMNPAELVSDPCDPALAQLAEDMFETMFDAPGVGLAAPQVHIPRRVVVYYVPESRSNDENEADLSGVPPTVLINPELELLGDTTEEDMIYMREGCLSLPGMSGLVRRPKRIGLKALDLKGKIIERELDGYHARVVQHECDHLEGILYPMRMDDLSSFGYDSEMQPQSEDSEE